MEKGLKFEDILNYLREGKGATREKWINKGLFIFYTDILDDELFIPDNIMKIIESRGVNYGVGGLMLINSNNTIIPFLPSPSDMFTDDWIVFSSPEDARAIVNEIRN